MSIENYSNNQYICKTPVLLIFFNRPDVLSETFNAIRKVKPSKLYLAQDGAREGNEEDKEKIEQCKEIVEKIDWECQVFKRYSDSNQGCGKGPYNAINWIFQNEETAIIIEDDCVANQSFFRFCDEMLEKYFYDTRIFMITGCNFELQSKEVTSSYFFGYSGTNCGWASWKRNWLKMDYLCSWTQNQYIFDNLSKMLSYQKTSKGKQELKNFKETYKKIQNGENISYWDVQWQAVRYLEHQLSIIPSKNLITNIGLGPTSTHAKHKKIPTDFYSEIGKIHFCYNKSYDLDFPLIHPIYVQQNYKYDEAIDNKISPSLFKKLMRKLGFERE